MSIQISDAVIAKSGMSEEAMKIELAVWFYQRELFTLGQAAKFLRISRIEMQRELAVRQINLHISPQDVENDFDTLQSLGLL